MPALTPYMRTVLADRPVCFWPMNEAAGSTVTDYGSAGLNGSWTGTPLLVNRPFPGGDRGPYAGASPYISVGDNSALSSGAGASGLVTVEVWFAMPALLANTSFLVSKGTGSNYEYELRVTSAGLLQWQNYNSSGASESSRSSGVIGLNRWNHAVGTTDKAANIQQLWLNGRMVESGTAGVTMSDGTAAVQMGRRADAGGVLYAGHLGHAAIYNKVLPANRIIAHYRAGLAIPRRPLTLGAAA